MVLSYSLHVGNKAHALTTVAKVSSASKHNLRKYKSEEYNKDNIVQLVGSDNILNDVKQIYHQEFDAVIKEYNSKQLRSDRKIDDYIKHVSEQKQNDVAVEIIIQIGDRNFWKDKNNLEKREMTRFFERQINSLKIACPSFKIANAVIHYDESSPHLHVVGVPVAGGYKKGLSKRCAKTRVFTQYSLSDLQDKMRSMAQLQMQSCILLNSDFCEGLKPKEQGRPFNMTKQQLTKFNQEKEKRLQEVNELTNNINSLMSQIKALQAQIDSLEDIKTKKEKEYHQRIDLFQGFVDKHMNEAIELRDKIKSLKKDYEDINNNIEITQNKLISVQNDIENIKDRKVSLNTEKLKIEEDINVLEEKKESLSNQNDKLENWYKENVPKIKNWQQVQNCLKIELQSIFSESTKQFHKILALYDNAIIDKDNAIKLSNEVNEFYKNKVSEVKLPENISKPLKEKVNSIIEDETEEVNQFIHRKRGR
ncbi:MAG: plasmid recombination protein [Anaeroplasmataceae bacterium]|nr:plasmid recombination protein [Anaeroplasmataceae bacterium]